MGRFFGPIALVWFLTLAALGLMEIVKEPSIFRALNPIYGVTLLFNNGLLGLVILGSVFLVVTGAEALYADMGHYGRGPIRAGWLLVAFPCLTLNYLGEGALVLGDPSAAASAGPRPVVVAPTSTQNSNSMAALPRPRSGSGAIAASAPAATRARAAPYRPAAGRRCDLRGRGA